jgi:hypothetical protein
MAKAQIAFAMQEIGDSQPAQWGSSSVNALDMRPYRIDCEEDRVLRAVLVGVLREDERR